MRILSYSLFESLNNINEKEIESTLTDICSDFTDANDVVINFDWGWAIKKGNKYDLRSDREINMFRSESGTSIIKKYLAEVDASNNRYVTVEFRRPRGFSTMNIWKDGIEDEFNKVIDFTENYFPNTMVINDTFFNPEIWAIRFSIVFNV